MKREPLVIELASFTMQGLPAIRVTCRAMPPSINQITSMIPLQRAREARLWRAQFAVATADSPVKFTRPVSLDVTYYPRTRQAFDLLNYPPKWAIDGLVDAGVIAGDSYRDMPLHRIAFGRVDPERPRFEMLIREVAPVEWVVVP